MKMKIIFVSGPYRADSKWGVWQNIQRASEKARELWLEGWAVICPHRNTMFFDGEGENDADIWINGDLEMVRRCDAIYMLKGWEKSYGSRLEHKTASNWGLEIIYEDDESGTQERE